PEVRLTSLDVRTEVRVTATTVKRSRGGATLSRASTHDSTQNAAGGHLSSGVTFRPSPNKESILPTARFDREAKWSDGARLLHVSRSRTASLDVWTTSEEGRLASLEVRLASLEVRGSRG